ADACLVVLLSPPTLILLDVNIHALHDYYQLIITLFFFFQAEDGIRDATVTGVQTCALPIYERERGFRENRLRDAERHRDHDRGEGVREDVADEQTAEAGAEGARAVDELLLLDREHLGARLARNTDAPGEPDGEEDVHEAGSQR